MEMEVTPVTVMETSQGEEVRTEYTDDEAARLILSNRARASSFGLDMARKHRKYGASDAQRPYLHREALKVAGEWPENGDPDAGGVSAIVDRLESAHQSGLKYPSMRFPTRLEEHGGLDLSRASKKSSRPGSVHVTPIEGDAYWGRIRTDGSFHARDETPEGTASVLKEIASDPEKAARTEGLDTGHCSFCGHDLTEEGSLEVGYGPVCAKHFGLPHPQH